ncbi:alpha/beta hydrolase [Nocardia alni]|uniref:alpha/beta hydrolase n=1 Tax=Nocardia alni TaxID=2815723 RepID=UPI001C2142F4|nr:alpha/beta hydrolase-fold protein [Nocardia alni]
MPPTSNPTPAVAPPPAPKMPSSTLDPMKMGFHHGVSLLHGWLPVTIEIVAIVLLIVAILRLTRRWWFIRVPIAIVLGVVGAIAAWQFTNNQGLASDPAPVLLWVTVGLMVGAIVIAVIGWPRARWWQRVAAILAIPFTIASAGVVLNQWVGYYPTAEAAWSSVTAGPLPHQTDMSALAGMRNTNPKTGVVVPVDIPDTNSGFKHRTEYVYLPPAYFHGATAPTLPAVMMIAGEFNTPGDWMRSGEIAPTIDKFTAANNGQAPILVFVDNGGSFNNDTECVNGPRGNAADHLTKDVIPYVEKTFHASSNPANWAVIGWSAGGTCAVDLTVMHPELFHTFVDIAGDLGPDSGNKAQTIARLYGGNAQQWTNFDPTTVMQKHGPYAGDIAGLYDDLTAMHFDRSKLPKGFKMPQVNENQVGLGGQDDMMGGGNSEVGAAEQLCAENKKVDIQCTIHTTQGGHTWQFAEAAFDSSLAWITARVGLPVSPAATGEL